MTTLITAASFDALARHTASPCVLIILPIDQGHPDDHRVHLELKSLIASARAQLKAMDTADIDDLLEPTEAVLQHGHRRTLKRSCVLPRTRVRGRVRHRCIRTGARHDG